MPPLKLPCRFDSVEAFLTAVRTELPSGGLLLRGAVAPTAAGATACVVELQVANEPKLELAAQLAAVVPGVGVAVTFPAPSREALAALAARLTAAADGTPPSAVEEPSGAPGAPEAQEEPGAKAGQPAVTRLRELSVTAKMQLALSGDRDERLQLLRDVNKTLHLHVLKNPRITMDEVLFAARLPALSADALRFIADHREWGAQAAVCAALAKNPQAPVPLVLKVLPKVPPADLRALAKGGARAPIVQAARKLVHGA